MYAVLFGAFEQCHGRDAVSDLQTMWSVPAAAEIAETYPDKHVTLVQSGRVLVPGYGARFSRRILEILRGLHVEVGSALVPVVSQSKRGKRQTPDVVI